MIVELPVAAVIGVAACLALVVLVLGAALIRTRYVSTPNSAQV